MAVLVDTSIWSLVLRRRQRDLNAYECRLVEEWVSLVKTGCAMLIGPIRQEVLSGIRYPEDFAALRRRLSAFGYLEIVPGDYDRAASFFNACRAKGVVGTPIDLLICAVAARSDVAIFSTDSDFQRYARHLPIRLHEVNAR